MSSRPGGGRCWADVEAFGAHGDIARLADGPQHVEGKIYRVARFRSLDYTPIALADAGDKSTALVGPRAARLRCAAAHAQTFHAGDGEGCARVSNCRFLLEAAGWRGCPAWWAASTLAPAIWADRRTLDRSSAVDSSDPYTLRGRDLRCQRQLTAGADDGDMEEMRQLATFVLGARISSPEPQKDLLKRRQR